MAHDVFINVHTSKNIKEVVVKYDVLESYKSSNVTQFQENCTMFDIQGIEKNGERNVHTALLLNLRADTKYVIQVWYYGVKRYTNIYKTPPDII